ncbi:MAG: ATP-dependent helicase [Hormoscilla sp. GM7CHS1pb]|nr:ATP-dependent helicase [Hormoscilla sp. GM7CHS1pb]
MPDDFDTHLTPTTSQSAPDPSLAATMRDRTIEAIANGLRSGQRSMALWQGGPLAISAVPGSGKSTGMAGAAAIAVARHQLHSRYQLVVVTFTRSAAASIKAKIREHLKTLSIPQNGVFVYTLHGLALNIAMRHPELSTLSLETSTIVSPNRSHQLLRTTVEQWIAAHPLYYQRLLEGNQFDGEETERLRRQSVLRTEVLPALAYTVVHEAKSSGLLPQDLAEIVATQNIPDEYQILTVAAGLYKNYQTLLRSRSLIDYDDMILGAMRVLEDIGARRLWQKQVFAVFEDEAQDSTPLQTRLLEILAADANEEKPLNLIRVGDPNQAINSTFTPADPIYFREFCQACQQQGKLATMDRAGRSTKIIIDAANYMLKWVNKYLSKNGSHKQASELPFSEQEIRLVAPGDPQPDANPPPEGEGLELQTPKDIYQTVAAIGQRIKDLFASHPERNAAVLVRTNDQGRFVASELKKLYGKEINIYEVAEQDRQSQVPREMLSLLQFMQRPHSPDSLKAALQVLLFRQLITSQDFNALASLPEGFIYPGPLDKPPKEPVKQIRRYCRSLLRARLELPPYQLISFLALTLNYNRSELATADKLAERVAQQTMGDSAISVMSGMLNVLNEIVNSESFEPVEVSEDDSPYSRPNQLTVITMHKAKGLDWDYVFLPFLHDSTIPGSLWVLPQAQFLGDFTLSEVARAQIRAHLHQQPLPLIGEAWEQAEYLKIAEEFRLLYVAMTRAKRLLWMSSCGKAPFSWNNFNQKRQGNLEDKIPCPVWPALKQRFPQTAVVPSKV